MVNESSASSGAASDKAAMKRGRGAALYMSPHLGSSDTDGPSTKKPKQCVEEEGGTSDCEIEPPPDPESRDPDGVDDGGECDDDVQDEDDLLQKLDEETEVECRALDKVHKDFEAFKSYLKRYSEETFQTFR